MTSCRLSRDTMVRSLQALPAWLWSVRITYSRATHTWGGIKVIKVIPGVGDGEVKVIRDYKADQPDHILVTKRSFSLVCGYQGWWR